MTATLTAENAPAKLKLPGAGTRIEVRVRSADYKQITKAYRYRLYPTKRQIEALNEQLGFACDLRNTHPTVKPIELMRWLVRLVTPPGGVVLDPFAGSGTTGCAAVVEGFNFLGVELDAEHAELARCRIAWWAEFEPGTDTIAAVRSGTKERVARDAGQLDLLGGAA